MSVAPASHPRAVAYADAARRLRIVATGLQFPEGPVALADGSVLVAELASGRLQRISAQGAVDTVAELGGSPNGVAIGPDGAAYVCNNGGVRFGTRPDGGLMPLGTADGYAGGAIQRVDLATGGVRTLYTECKGHRLSAPNDIVFDRSGGFWFTDMGKHHRHGRDHGGVYYAKADGGSIALVVPRLLSPNGIGLSPEEDRLYVADTETARVWEYRIDAPGRISRQPWPVPQGGARMLACASDTYQRFDSLAMDAEGNVNVATLINGAITVVSPEHGVLQQVAMPDLLPTNLCFGGPGLRTVFVTLSMAGALGAIDDWPVAGLPLHFQDLACTTK